MFEVADLKHRMITQMTSSVAGTVNLYYYETIAHVCQLSYKYIHAVSQKNYSDYRGYNQNCT